MAKRTKAMDNTDWLLDAIEVLRDGEISDEDERALAALAFVVRRRVAARPALRTAFNMAFDCAVDGKEGANVR